MKHINGYAHPALSALQVDIIALLRSNGREMEKEDIQTRLCVASASRLDEALDGLRKMGTVIFRDGSSRAIHLLPHNRRTNLGSRP